VSDTNKPVAWAVTPNGRDEEIDCEFIYPDAATAGDVALGCDGVVLPLFRPKPPPATTLTDEEREALNRGIDALYGVEDVSDGACRRDDAAARTLLALLERLK
jgi:hypothetical protein